MCVYMRLRVLFVYVCILFRISGFLVKKDILVIFRLMGILVIW